MIPKILFLLPLAIISPQEPATNSRVPVVIKSIDARFEGLGYASGSNDHSIIKVCNFHFTCLLAPNDSTFWSCLPLVLVGDFPDRRRCTFYVNKGDLEVVNENLLSYQFNFGTSTSGSAAFTLIPTDLPFENNVAIYSERSNLTYLTLECYQ
jgi:hypothetical protein